MVTLALCAVMIVCLPPSSAMADNASLAYRVVGEYRNESIDDGSTRGYERFELSRHPDGSRTLVVSTDLTARGALFTLVLRATSGFRPIEAFANYWNAGIFKGSGHFVVEGEAVLARSTGPAGLQERRTPMPVRFSIGAHPVSADGWHTASHDAAGPSRQLVTMYSVDAGADPSKPVLGTAVNLEIEYLGVETVDVPAGRFEARRYRLAGMNDLWVATEDRLVVKSELPARKLRYVLTSLRDYPRTKSDPALRGAEPTPRK